MGQQIAVIEFSTRTTAVWLRQDDKGLVLANYCFVEGPLRLADCSREALTQHLTAVRRGLGAKTRDVILTLGAQDSALRTVEAPCMSRHELRRLLKLNANHFFHEDISGHALDCIPAGSTEHRRAKVGPVMVGSTRQDLLDNLQGAAKRAGFNPVQITLNQAGLANAAVKGMDKLIHKEALMLLDIGADLSSVSFLVEGTLVLNHTINLGNNQLGTRLADAYKVPSHISEEHKSSVIQSNIQNALRPLAHEVQAAIDYFEDSHGKRVLDGYVAGGLVRSNLVVEMLQLLEVPCRVLDTRPFLALEVPAEKASTIDKDLPQLAAAIGAAVGRLNHTHIQLDFLAERADTARELRRDPVRLAIGLGATLAVLLLLWTGLLQLQNARLGTQISRMESEVKALEKPALEARTVSTKAGEVERALTALDAHATNRFLWASPLNALQHAMVEDIQVVGLKIEQRLLQLEATKGSTNAPAKPAETREQLTLTITAKSFGEAKSEEAFMEQLAAVPYFKTNLRKKDPVLLKNRVPRQADPLDTSKIFTLFTIECVYPERVLGHD